MLQSRPAGRQQRCRAPRLRARARRASLSVAHRRVPASHLWPLRLRLCSSLPRQPAGGEKQGPELAETGFLSSRTTTGQGLLATAARVGTYMASTSQGQRAGAGRGPVFKLPSYSPEPLQAICIRFVAANLEQVESLKGLDELNVAMITALVLQSLRLTPASAALLRDTGFASVTKMLEPYKAVDLIPEPASESPTAWDGRKRT